MPAMHANAATSSCAVIVLCCAETACSFLKGSDLPTVHVHLAGLLVLRAQLPSSWHLPPCRPCWRPAELQPAPATCKHQVIARHDEELHIAGEH